MKKKIHKELVTIREELQAIRKNLDLGNRMIMIRRPYDARYELVTVKEGLQILENLKPEDNLALSCRAYVSPYKSGRGDRDGYLEAK